MNKILKKVILISSLLLFQAGFHATSSYSTEPEIIEHKINSIMDLNEDDRLKNTLLKEFIWKTCYRKLGHNIDTDLFFFMLTYEASFSEKLTETSSRPYLFFESLCVSTEIFATLLTKDINPDHAGNITSVFALLLYNLSTNLRRIDKQNLTENIKKMLFEDYMELFFHTFSEQVQECEHCNKCIKPYLFNLIKQSLLTLFPEHESFQIYLNEHFNHETANSLCNKIEFSGEPLPEDFNFDNQFKTLKAIYNKKIDSYQKEFKSSFKNFENWFKSDILPGLVQNLGDNVAPGTQKAEIEDKSSEYKKYEKAPEQERSSLETKKWTCSSKKKPSPSKNKASIKSSSAIPAQQMVDVEQNESSNQQMRALFSPKKTNPRIIDQSTVYNLYLTKCTSRNAEEKDFNQFLKNEYLDQALNLDTNINFKNFMKFIGFDEISQIYKEEKLCDVIEIFQRFEKDIHSKTDQSFDKLAAKLVISTAPQMITKIEHNSAFGQELETLNQLELNIEGILDHELTNGPNIELAIKNNPNLTMEQLLKIKIELNLEFLTDQDAKQLIIQDLKDIFYSQRLPRLYAKAYAKKLESEAFSTITERPFLTYSIYKFTKEERDFFLIEGPFHQTLSEISESIYIRPKPSAESQREPRP